MGIAVLPVVPLALFALWFGYSGVAGSLEPMLVPLFWLALPVLAIAAAAASLGLTRVSRGRLGWPRRSLLVLATLLLTAGVYWHAREMGCWVWEQHVLAPRIDSLRRSLEADKPALDGLNVSGVARGRQGFLLYRRHADAVVPGFGIFVSYDRNRAPEREGPITFSDSSVAGVYCFHEYP